jgi:hypothetical protein
VAGAFQAQDFGRVGRDGIGAAALHDVGVVHSGGFYRDDDFVRLGPEWIYWAPLEHVRRSRLVENDCIGQRSGPFAVCGRGSNCDGAPLELPSQRGLLSGDVRHSNSFLCGVVAVRLADA